MSLNQAKVALVADWMTNFAGAEQVLLSLSRIFPDSPIFTSVHVPEKMPQFVDRKIHTSFLQKIPFLRKKHQFLIKWMPLAFESLDLSDFDLVISSSHACAKGIITKPRTLHVSYCHTPLRLVWDDYHQYLHRYNLNPLIKNFLPKTLSELRIWDRLAADRVDYFVANSHFIKNRIKKYYRREAKVIYPPVQVDNFSISAESTGDFFLAVGRLVPNKQMDLLIAAFNEIGEKLIIAGDGVDYRRLKKMAHKNIIFAGRVSDPDLLHFYQNCQAFVMPQEEDFGIAPVEAMACGRPVIAYKSGGAEETIIENKTGIFFLEQNKFALKEAVNKFSRLKFSPSRIREHALQFSESRFQKEMLKFLKEHYRDWQKFMS